MSDSIYDYYDDLRLCEICGNQYTESDMCGDCQRQEQIDNENPPDNAGIVECPNCFHWNYPINTTCQICGEILPG